MPFDPNLPQANTEADATQMRGQLTGLKDLIDAVQTITAAQVDSVTTLPPGEPAQVGLGMSGSTLHFSFAIPQGVNGAEGSTGPQGSNGSDGANGANGSDGANGANGSDGSPGTPGETGPAGPPFAQALVDGVTTLNPGDNATVGVSFDGSNVHFAFGIPRGADGSNGSDGAPGQPGEVTNADLSNAISGTSSNSNGVSTLGTAISDPPTQSEVQQIVNKLDELLNALRR